MGGGRLSAGLQLARRIASLLVTPPPPRCRCLKRKLTPPPALHPTPGAEMVLHYLPFFKDEVSPLLRLLWLLAAPPSPSLPWRALSACTC